MLSLFSFKMFKLETWTSTSVIYTHTHAKKKPSFEIVSSVWFWVSTLTSRWYSAFPFIARLIMVNFWNTCGCFVDQPCPLGDLLHVKCIHAVKLQDYSTLCDLNPSGMLRFNFLMGDIKWVVVLWERCAEGPLGFYWCLLWEHRCAAQSFILTSSLFRWYFPLKVSLHPSTTFISEHRSCDPCFICFCCVLCPKQHFVSG